jgi:hypothetical protein
MQGLNPGSTLSEESPSVSTPLELMKQSQRPPSRSMVDTLKGKTALRSVRESVQVALYLIIIPHVVRRSQPVNKLDPKLLGEARDFYLPVRVILGRRP